MTELKLLALTCESCGARVEVAGKIAQFKCVYCGTLLAPNHEARKQAQALEELAERREAELARQKAEEDERKRAEEWERAKPERAARETIAGLWIAFGYFYFLYLGPALMLTSWAATGYKIFAPSVPLTGYFGSMAWAPVINLFYAITTPFVLLGALVMDGLGAVFWLLIIAVFWAVIVPLGAVVTFGKHM